MKKKKVIESDKYIGYLTLMEYFATGEGFTSEINFSYAYNKKEAIEKHLDRFNVIDKGTRDYFRPGIEACEFNGKKAKEIFTWAFHNGDAMYEHMNKAGREFYFKIHYNHS